MVLFPENILNYKKIIANDREKEVNVCEAAGYGIMRSQGYTRYICKIGCKTNICTCKNVMFYVIQSVTIR